MKSVDLIPLLIAGMALSSCTQRLILHGQSDSQLPEQEKQSGGQLVVWFVKPGGNDVQLVPATRAMMAGTKMQSAVVELLRGPNADEVKSGVATEIPRGTILLGVKRQGSDLELNLSQRFASGGGANSMETRLEQLRRTVAAAADGQKVYLDVEGKRLSEGGGEGLEIKQPIN